MVWLGSSGRDPVIPFCGRAWVWSPACVARAFVAADWVCVMNGRLWLALKFGVAASVACGGAVFAQSGGSSSPPAGGSGSGGGGLVEPVEDEVELLPFEPVLVREGVNSRDWTAQLRLNLYSEERLPRTNRRTTLGGLTTRFDLEAAVIVLPVPIDSGYADVKEDAPRGWVMRGGDRLDETPRMLEGYQSGQRLAAFDIRNQKNVTTLRAKLEFDVVSYETDIDEERAQRIEWSDELVSLPEVSTSLSPQMFIESDDERIVAMVESWTEGDPRRVRPYVLAKFLAGKVIEFYQFTDARYDTAGRGREAGIPTIPIVEGLLVRGASESVRVGGGSPYDLANVLCAVYRAAGLPARVVIGYDQRRERDRLVPDVIVWVEFFLTHPGTARGEWIPVDIVRQRENSSRAPRLDRKWQFFGRNEDSEHYVPVSFHWQPPTAIVNTGAVALWGWLPLTEDENLPVVDAQILINAFGTPLRGDDREEVRRRQERTTKRGGEG